MDIKYFQHEEGINRLAQLLYDEKLVPVIGAGFTCGILNKHGERVPNGSTATTLMNRIMSNLIGENVSETEFHKTAQRFISSVSVDERCAFFKKYFTNVYLSGYRKKFLSLPWGYIYTINIDDGIENSSEYKAVGAYNKLRNSVKADKPLFKLHGDAMTEVTTDTDVNIVFSTSQYIESLKSTDNTTMINVISADYKEKNLLFLGCSLLGETDLQYIYKVSQKDMSEGLIRAIVRTEKLTKLEEIDMSSFGINTVILVNDYETFYLDIISAFGKINVETTYPYVNPKSIICEDPSYQLFAGGYIFDSGNNEFHKPPLFQKRKITDEIVSFLRDNSCAILYGRRFSGKTYVMCSFSELLSSYSIYYFPSTTLFDDDKILNLFKSKDNSVFLFDSDSVSDATHSIIASNLHLIKSNNNKIIIAVNSTDSYLVNMLAADMFRLENTFYEQEELKPFNNAANFQGLIERNMRNKNLDYLERLRTEQKIDIKFFNELPKTFRADENVMLYVLAVQDKAFLSELYALNITQQSIYDFVERMRGLVEIVPVSRGEQKNHSGLKLVNNSKYVILSLVKTFSRDIIIKTVERIVKLLSNDSRNRRLCIKSYMFDTLNQLFEDAGDLIIAVYKNLQQYLYDNMDYWLQRAKSIYRLRSKDYIVLLEAYKHAKKALTDGNERMFIKASLATSLICCLLANTNEVKCDLNQQREFECEAINCAYTVINSSIFSIEQLNNERANKRTYHDLILDVCNKATLQDSQQPRSARNNAFEIIRRFENANSIN